MSGTKSERWPRRRIWRTMTYGDLYVVPLHHYLTRALSAITSEGASDSSGDYLPLWHTTSSTLFTLHLRFLVVFSVPHHVDSFLIASCFFPRVHLKLSGFNEFGGSRGKGRVCYCHQTLLSHNILGTFCQNQSCLCCVLLLNDRTVSKQ